MEDIDVPPMDMVPMTGPELVARRPLSCSVDIVGLRITTEDGTDDEHYVWVHIPAGTSIKSTMDHRIKINGHVYGKFGGEGDLDARWWKGHKVYSFGATSHLYARGWGHFKVRISLPLLNRIL